MSKHTPGPWELVSLGWRGQFIYGTDERVPSGRRLISEVDLNFDGAEANALLIAAAPDLLQALKIISIWAKNGSTEKDFDDIAKLANEALEKAKEEVL